MASHFGSVCPARKATCNLCKKVGHYGKVCKTKLHVNKIGNAQAESSNLIGHILLKHNNSDNRWNRKIMLENTSLNFKVDAAADMANVPKSIYL